MEKLRRELKRLLRVGCYPTVYMGDQTITLPPVDRFVTRVVNKKMWISPIPIFFFQGERPHVFDVKTYRRSTDWSLLIDTSDKRKLIIRRLAPIMHDHYLMLSDIALWQEWRRKNKNRDKYQEAIRTARASILTMMGGG